MTRFNRIGEEDPSITLCRMVAETKYEDLPPTVTDFAKKLVLDILGNHCWLISRGHPSSN